MQTADFYEISYQQGPTPVIHLQIIIVTVSINVRDCLIQLAEHNRVQLIWVPSHEGIVGNETVDQLARTGSEHPFTGPEPACGISIGVAKKAVRDWTDRDYEKYWESTTGLKQAKGFISGPSARRTKDLLRLNRDQLRWVVGLLTGALPP
jgi:hypothetical protein